MGVTPHPAFIRIARTMAKNLQYLAYRFRLGPTMAFQTVGGRGQEDRVKNLDTTLTALAVTYNKVRNAMMLKWLLMHKQVQESHPESKKSWMFNPEQCAEFGFEGNESKMLIEAGKKVGKNIYVDNYGAVQKEIQTVLKAKMPIDHLGSARYKHEAILDCEVSLPSFRSLTIPTKNRNIRIAENGLMLVGSGKNESLLRASVAVASEGKRCVVVGLPLYAGRAPFAAFTLMLHDRFQQEIIDGIRDGKCRIGDSKLVKNVDKGYWELHLSYSRDLHRSVPAEHANTAAYLIPMNEQASCPFVLAVPDSNGGFKHIPIANNRSAQQLVKDVNDYEQKAKTEGFYYRKFRIGGGHGRKKITKKQNYYHQQSRHLRKSFTRSLIVTVCKLAIANNCGTMVYLEPTRPSRDCSWFSKQGMSFGWALFEADLRSKVEYKLHHYTKTQRVRREEFARDHTLEHIQEVVSRAISREAEIAEKKASKAKNAAPIEPETAVA